MPEVTAKTGGLRRRPLLRSLAAALAVLAAASCDQRPNTLEGSLTEIIDLEFWSVEISIIEDPDRPWADRVIVNYWTPHLEGRDVVFKLVAQQRPSEVVPGKLIDLGPREDGSARAECTRAVADDPIRTYAAIKSGTLVLDAIPKLDQPVGGEFRVTFDEGGDAGKGRTAFGRFRTLKVAPGN